MKKLYRFYTLCLLLLLCVSLFCVQAFAVEDILGLIVAIALLVGIIYMLFKPYKEATKLKTR